MFISPRRLGILIAIGAASVALSACGPTPASQSTSNPSTAPTKTQPSEKSGDTTKTGMVSGSEGKFFLQTAGQPPQEIDSYTVDLQSYVGQTITVTGQFSGDTLFVGSVK